MFARQSLRFATGQIRRQSVRFASGHGEMNTVGHTLPTDVSNKPWLAVKIIIYAGTGFGLPFYAVHYHLNKQ